MTVRLFKAYNGPMPTTASQLAVTTGTAIKTLLQIQTPSTADFTIKSWGISFDGAAAAAGVEVELVDTASVAATVTAHTSTGLIKMNVPTGPASVATLSTTATGYTASAEGTITATRVLDAHFVQPTAAAAFFWPLSDEPVLPVSSNLRVRVKAAAAVNAICWVVWGE